MLVEVSVLSSVTLSVEVLITEIVTVLGGRGAPKTVAVVVFTADRVLNFVLNTVFLHFDLVTTRVLVFLESSVGGRGESDSEMGARGDVSLRAHHCPSTPAVARINKTRQMSNTAFILASVSGEKGVRKRSSGKLHSFGLSREVPSRNPITKEPSTR